MRKLSDSEGLPACRAAGGDALALPLPGDNFEGDSFDDLESTGAAFPGDHALVVVILFAESTLLLVELSRFSEVTLMVSFLSFILPRRRILRGVVGREENGLCGLGGKLLQSEPSLIQRPWPALEESVEPSATGCPRGFESLSETLKGRAKLIGVDSEAL